MMTLAEQLQRLYEDSEIFEAIPSDLFDRPRHKTMTECLLANFHHANREGSLPKWLFLPVYGLRTTRKYIGECLVTKSDRMAIIRAGHFYIQTQMEYEALTGNDDLFNSSGLYGFIMCDRLQEEDALLGTPATLAAMLQQHAAVLPRTFAKLCRVHNDEATNALLYLLQLLTSTTIDPQDNVWSITHEELS